MAVTIGINTSPALASGTTGGTPQRLGRVAGPVWTTTGGCFPTVEGDPAVADEKKYAVAAVPETTVTTIITQAFEIS